MSAKLFSAANKLNDYSIMIGDISIIKECIISAEIAYTNSSPKIQGTIIIDDLYDLNLQQDWNTISVEIMYIDIFETEVKRKFVILNITEKYDEKNDKLFVIKLQDEFSYVLEHSFLSKSFTGNIITCIEEYITKLKLTSYTTDFSSFSGDAEGFVIPNHINNLDAFMIELNRKGLAFYQTKDKVVIKSLTDLKPSSLPINGLYMNETDNQLYQNRITEIRNTFNNRELVPPSTRAVAFDPLTKVLIELESNEITDYQLNSDTMNPQDSTGVRDVYQIHKDFNQNIKEMKDAFLSRGKIEMVVNGYAKNDLNQIYELALKGNKSTSVGQSSGNLIIGGKYISYKLIDKIIADTMIQLIHLHRADLTKFN